MRIDSTLQAGEILGKAVWIGSLAPLPGVQLTVINYAGKSTTADDNGNFRLAGLPHALVSLQARRIGLRVDTITVDARNGVVLQLAMNWMCHA